ncbi:unnamed protein product [Calicophoron daubneyi]|uniref:Glutathione transferase n=1 Tax=Calicophoron daubneyi TaxID=300641 RepID=A0AAV2U1P6_CALDB
MSGDTVQRQKHFKAGDPEPPIDQSKYTIFGFRFCPFTERVLYTVHQHKISYDLVPIALASKPDWFLRMCPTGKVPMLMNNGDKLVESDLIMQFMDQLRGEQVSLLSVCGTDKFRQTVELAGQFFKPVRALMYQVSYDPQTEHDLRSACEQVNSTVKGDFYDGNELSLADFAIFPMVDRLEVALGRLKGTEPEKIHEFTEAEVDCSEWPKLVHYLCRMRKLPVVAAVRQSSRLVAMYSASVRDGHPDPEIC